MQDQRQRMTRQRQVILEELRKLSSHPTANGLHERVRRRLPRTSLGTIYRNLEVLSKQGIIQKLGLAGSQRRFDADVSHHYHIRCRRCGRVDDVPIKPVGELDDALRSMTDYDVQSHRLEFIGLCPRCKRERPADQY